MAKTVSRARAARREANRPPPVPPSAETNTSSPFAVASRRTLDGISNAMARLGLNEANQASFASYNFNPISRLRIVLDWAYRGSWVARMAVDAIAEDMTREGVELGSDLDPDDKARLLAACSDEYQLWDRVCDALKWARLYGGAGIYIMIDGQKPETPLRLDTVGKGSLQNFVVLDRWMLDPSLNDLVTDPRSPDIGLPKYYRVVADAPVVARTTIHHSRFVRFEGADIPYWQRLAENFWSLSVLEPVWDRLIAFDSTTQGIAQLVYKAHLRTLSVEGLRTLLGSKDDQALEGFYSQVGMMRSFQNNEGLTVIDAADTFEAHQYTFTGLNEVALQFAEQVCGAIQVPLVRFFGQAPAGLNSTGESDWKNYEDGIKKLFNRRLKSPLIRLLLPVIARSKGIKLPDEFTVSMPPLLQMSHEEKARVAGQITSTIGDAVDRGLITNRGTAIKELHQQSLVTGIWSNITDQDIKDADEEPPMSRAGEMGAEGDPDALPSPDDFLPQGADEEPDDGFLPQGVSRHLRRNTGAIRRFLPRAANDRRARMRDANLISSRYSKAVGFEIVVESAAGTPRWDGKLNPGHYGYFDGTLGLDGDAVDVMIGPAWTDKVFVVEQRKLDGDLNQHKVFLGYELAEDAAVDFLRLWPRSALGATREMTIGDLKAWLEQRRPSAARLRAVT